MVGSCLRQLKTVAGRARYPSLTIHRNASFSSREGWEEMARVKPLAELDRPPDEVLGVEPNPQSDAEFARGVSELAWIRSFRKTQEGLLQQRIALLKAEYEQKYFVTIELDDGSTKRVAFADREQALESKLLAYAKAHKGDGFFPTGKQTRELTHGIVAWKDGTLGVRTREGETDKTVLEKIDAKTGLVKKLVELLADLVLGRGVRAETLVRVAQSVNRSAILEAFKKQKLTNEQLEPYGLEVGKPQAEFWIDTTEYTLESASQETR
jgi:hypothetical protein